MTLAYQSNSVKEQYAKSIDNTNFIKVIIDDKPKLKDNFQKTIKELLGETVEVDIVSVSPLFENEYLDMIL